MDLPQASPSLPSAPQIQLRVVRASPSRPGPWCAASGNKRGCSELTRPEVPGFSPSAHATPCLQPARPGGRPGSRVAAPATGARGRVSRLLKHGQAHAATGALLWDYSLTQPLRSPGAQGGVAKAGAQPPSLCSPCWHQGGQKVSLLPTHHPQLFLGWDLGKGANLPLLPPLLPTFDGPLCSTGENQQPLPPRGRTSSQGKCVSHKTSYPACLGQGSRSCLLQAPPPVPWSPGREGVRHEAGWSPTAPAPERKPPSLHWTYPWRPLAPGVPASGCGGGGQALATALNSSRCRGSAAARSPSLRACCKHGAGLYFSPGKGRRLLCGAKGHVYIAGCVCVCVCVCVPLPNASRLCNISLFLYL